jgi:hypothetical protein
MNKKNAAIVTFLSSVIGMAGVNFSPASFASAPSQAQDAAQPAVARRIGTIKAINGNALTLTPDSGPEVAVTVQPNARLLRIAPGEKDPKANATPVPLQDLQVGDRILVAGKPSDDNLSLVASSVVVMKRSDLEARQQQELQDWQKRGMGGLVGSVDAASGTVTISVSGFGGTKKTIAVHASKDTLIRRYAPESVKFEDAKVSTLQDIHPGDQLRARGNRSADGAELAAEEIVAGSFRDFTATITSLDPNSGTISLQELQSKKQVLVKVTANSELHKLPVDVAQRFAVWVKGAAGVAGAPGSGANPPSGAPEASTANGSGARSGNSSAGAWRSGMGGGARSGGVPDFQQIVSHTPAATMADLHKGDVVRILATEGTPSTASTVITLVSGIEPILQAAPNGSQAMMLAPWSLGGAPSGDAGP